MKDWQKYVIVTPARNEEEFIELTIQSVIAQTILPLKWVIVSDGSTDDTDSIVEKYASHHPWIELVRMPERTERNFAGKVHAFNAGWERVRKLGYNVIVSLDADVSFGADYFSYLLNTMCLDPKLGIVGTPFREVNGEQYDYRFVSIEHVSGACQVFRRACFEAIGGYRAVKGGSIDHIAVINARMKGWKTRTFTEDFCLHHRPMGTAERGILLSRFKLGIKDYRIGNHPVWEVFRVVYQMTKRPLCLGGIALASGYFWAGIRRIDRPVPQDLVDFHRREQIQRLRKVLNVGGAPSTRTLSPGDPNLSSPGKDGS